jgi:hypothetical protein
MYRTADAGTFPDVAASTTATAPNAAAGGGFTAAANVSCVHVPSSSVVVVPAVVEIGDPPELYHVIATCAAENPFFE